MVGAGAWYVGGGVDLSGHVAKRPTQSPNHPRTTYHMRHCTSGGTIRPPNACSGEPARQYHASPSVKRKSVLVLARLSPASNA
jgi:hypothetical protein